MRLLLKTRPRRGSLAVDGAGWGRPPAGFNHELSGALGVETETPVP
jgi:hypothetical protein